jgi:aspartyl protease family protein
MRLQFLYLVGLFTAASAAPGDIMPASSPGATALSVHNSNTAGMARSQGLAIGRADDGLFYLEGIVERQEVRFLVDTGATHVVLSHADATRANGSPIAEPNDVIKTAGGAAKVDWVVIKELEIRGKVLRNVKAAVPHQDTGLSLLGQNALAQFDVLRIDGDTLTLGN